MESEFDVRIDEAILREKLIEADGQEPFNLPAEYSPALGSIARQRFLLAGLKLQALMGQNRTPLINSNFQSHSRLRNSHLCLFLNHDW